MTLTVLLLLLEMHTAYVGWMHVFWIFCMVECNDDTMHQRFRQGLSDCDVALAKLLMNWFCCTKAT